MLGRRLWHRQQFLSTLSLRRATITDTVEKMIGKISIHALLAESDLHQVCTISITVKISIHALLAESDRPSSKTGRRFRYFYPRSPCGERLKVGGIDVSKAPISIHALLAESDQGQKPITLLCMSFLSTLSLRRATLMKERTINWHQFLSTLSLRRATIHGVDFRSAFMHFYPRSPCGERRFAISAHCFDGRISIHALLAESDIA